MKYYFYILIFAFHMLPSHGHDGSDQEYSEYDCHPEFYEYQSTWKSRESDISSTSYTNLKLIKTNIPRFARDKFWKSNNEAMMEIVEGQAEIIENMVSREVENFLWRLKSSLEKEQSSLLVFNGDEFSQYITQSIEHLFKLSPTLLFSATEAKEQEESSTYGEGRAETLGFLLDRYFRFQLLSFGYALLLPISESNIEKIQSSSSTIKLQFFKLMANELPLDTITSWSRKKQFFLRLDQAVRSRTDPVKLLQVPSPFMERLKVEITQNYLQDYLEESYSFINNAYHREIENILTISALEKTSLYYFEQYLLLYSDFEKICPDLFTHTEDKRHLLEQITTRLKKLYSAHMHLSARSFLQETVSCHDLPSLLNILNTYVLETQKFNAKFTMNYLQLFLMKEHGPQQSFLTEQFQGAITRYFEDTLLYIENHHEKSRLSITKTLSSLGWISSHAKEFLNKVEATYKTVFPFLFDEKITSGADFKGKIKALVEKIDAQEQESLNQTIDTLSQVKNYLDVSKWWSTNK